MSVLGGVWLFVLGFVWWKGLDIPEFNVADVGFGPELPGRARDGSGAVGLGLGDLGLLAYSVARWRK